MSFFAGLSAGFGEAQGKYNDQMLDFMNKKSQAMASLYGHLADTVLQKGDPYGIAPELFDRSMQWSQAHPLFNSKGYKDLIKSEKGGIHDIIDRANQRQISAYHAKNFASGGSQPQQPTPTPSGTTGVGFGAMGAPPTPEAMIAAQPSPQPTPQPFNPYQTMPNGQAAGMSPAYTPQQNTPQGGEFGGSGSIEEMLNQLTGGQPLTGPLGNSTPIGQIAMSVVPDVMKHRMDMKYKLQMIENKFNTRAGGFDKRSPTGSAEYSAAMREAGMNSPVTQWRGVDALFKDENGKYYMQGVSKSFRDQSHWLTTGPGQETEVFPIMENPQVKYAQNGSAWVVTPEGLRPLDGRMPIQVGTSSTQTPNAYGGVERSETKLFSGGQLNPAIVPPPGPTPNLPPGLPANITKGEPPRRTSTTRPSDAYKPGAGYSLEKLQNSHDYIDRQIAQYIQQPESFDLGGRDRTHWNTLFDARTNGAVTQAPVPIKNFKGSFQEQRKAAVTGFYASRDISNILSDTDGKIVGMVTGKILIGMNKLGSASGMKMAINAAKGVFGKSTPEQPGADTIDPRSPEGQQISREALAELAQERPDLAYVLRTKGDLLVSKAADLITTTRLFNFADVRNVIGGVQGVKSVYQELKDALLNPGMDPQLILGHLGAINRNMADGLLYLENARWGPKIPYIREKELMSEMYWPPYIEDLITKTQAAVAQKGGTLSRQDALFMIWRKGGIKADPGNRQNYKIEFEKE